MECYRIKNEKEKPEMLQLQKTVFSDFFSQAKQENNAQRTSLNNITQLMTHFQKHCTEKTLFKNAKTPQHTPP